MKSTSTSATSICFPVTILGGGGTYINVTGGAASPCGTGGQGATPSGPGSPRAATAGSTNTGGGGGGGFHPGSLNGSGAAGGPGIVIARFPSAASVSVAPCTNTVTSCVGPANDKVARFTVSGTLTIS